MTRVMLRDAKFPNEYWAEALKTATYIKNRVSTKSRNWMSPYEIWHGSKPDLSKMIPFGEKVHYRIPSANRRKLDNQGARALFLGYDLSNGIYRLLDVNKNNVIRNRDVKVTTWDHVEKDNENVHNEGDNNTRFQENDELEQMESQSPTSHVLPGVETTDTDFIDNNSNENSSDISDYYYENGDTELEKNYEWEDYRTIRGRTTKKPFRTLC